MDEKNIIMTASQCQQSHFAKSNIHRERSRVAFRRWFAMRVWCVVVSGRINTVQEDQSNTAKIIIFLLTMMRIEHTS